jgi:5-methylcytosine-specific restriction protein A
MVTLTDVDREGVLAAISEYDRLGRHTFLRQTGFGPANAYFLQHEDRLYDSKAIMGYAHGVSTGTALGPRDFSGGEKTVAPRLEGLGFTVLYLPHLDWERDELILATALVESNGWRQVGEGDERVQDLSALLRQSIAIHPLDNRHPDFRNPASVARKTQNIASVHPSHSGAPSHTSMLDREVVEDFRADPAGMHAAADRVRELVARDELGHDDLPDLDEAASAAREGGLALRAHLRRERDPKLRQKKLADTKRRGSPVACEVCAFDFGRAYGLHGLDYIECHHRIPLHVSGETRTRLADLALLCSNCHRMIHRAKRWLTVEELKAMFHAQKDRSSGHILSSGLA